MDSGDERIEMEKIFRIKSNKGVSDHGLKNALTEHDKTGEFLCEVEEITEKYNPIRAELTKLKRPELPEKIKEAYVSDLARATNKLIDFVKYLDERGK